MMIATPDKMRVTQTSTSLRSGEGGEHGVYPRGHFENDKRDSVFIQKRMV